MRQLSQSMEDALVQVCKRKSAGAFVDLAQVRRCSTQTRSRTAAPPGARRRAARDQGWSQVPAAGHFVCRPCVTASASTPAEPMARTPSAREISGGHGRRRGNRNRKAGDRPAGVAPSGRRPAENRRDGQHTDRSAVVVHHSERHRTETRAERAATSFRPSSIRHVTSGRRAIMSRRNVSCKSRRLPPGCNRESSRIGFDELRRARIFQDELGEVVGGKRVDDDVALRAGRMGALARTVVTLEAEHVSGAPDITQRAAAAGSSQSDTVPCWMTKT